MVKIILPAGWTVGRDNEFESGEGSLPEVIGRFAADHPDYRHRVFGADDRLLTYINFCVDDTVIPRHLRETTIVEAGSTIIIMPPMAGG